MKVPAYDWVGYHADVRPGSVALIDDFTDRTLTYAQLDDRVRRLTVWLANRGVDAGDRVAFLAANTTDIFEALFACAHLGAVLVPLNWRLATPELQFILEDSRPSVLIFETGVHDLVQHLDVPIRLALGDQYEQALTASDAVAAPPVTATHDDPWAIMYTSGTTGRPKGAIITHGMFFYNAINIGDAVGLTQNTKTLNVLPTFHAGGLNLYATPCLRLGATVVNLREFDPHVLLRYLTAGDVTHFFGVPAVYQFLAEDPRWATADLSGVKSWACGGSAMPVTLLTRYAERGIVIRQGMGLTETSPTLFLCDEEHALSKAGSVGKPVLHTAIKVVDEHGNEVPQGMVGELWASGPNVTPGYWGRPAANAESFTHGWLHTGDAARVDEDGYVYIVDRWKDMYISGGENVYPAEVEQVFFQHPNVLDVAVIGVPDDRWGESGVAVVVPRDADRFDADDILAFCGDKLAGYKIPKRVVRSVELPRNAAGKVLKRQLRDEVV